MDGFITTENDSLEWLFQFGDVNDTGFPDFIHEVGALAMGASTYQWMLDRPIHPAQRPGAPCPCAQPTWVFTHRNLPSVPGADIRFVQGAVAPIHQAMAAAAAGRNIWLVGGG